MIYFFVQFEKSCFFSFFFSAKLFYFFIFAFLESIASKPPNALCFPVLLALVNAFAILKSIFLNKIVERNNDDKKQTKNNCSLRCFSNQSANAATASSCCLRAAMLLAVSPAWLRTSAAPASSSSTMERGTLCSAAYTTTSQHGAVIGSNDVPSWAVWRRTGRLRLCRRRRRATSDNSARYLHTHTIESVRGWVEVDEGEWYGARPWLLCAGAWLHRCCARWRWRRAAVACSQLVDVLPPLYMTYGQW